MRSTASALRDRFERLFDCNDHRDRGRQFEQFLGERLRLDGFRVEANPRIATPRQTDLFARLGTVDFVIEAKWQAAKIDVADIDSMRVRLQRVRGDITGCFFSMSDYSEAAIKQIVDDRTREILLFNAAEINAVFAHRASVSDLITKKRDALRINACVLFTETHASFGNADPQWPIPRFQFVTSNGAVPWLHTRTARDDAAFLLTTPEVTLSGDCVLLKLRLQIATTEELAGLFSIVVRDIGISDEGVFAIHQTSHAWYGFGIKNFTTAIDAWAARYTAAGVDRPHHSEELAYFDFDNGRLLAITARQRVGDSVFLHSAELELYLPGIPVNPAGIRHLCDATQHPNSYLENVTDLNADEVRCEYHQTAVAPVAQIIATGLEDETVVVGLAVKNPFFGENAIALPQSKRTSSALSHFVDAELLLCDLDHWHAPEEIVKAYFLRHLSALWAGHMPLLTAMCTWDEITSGSTPRRTVAEVSAAMRDKYAKHDD